MKNKFHLIFICFFSEPFKHLLIFSNFAPKSKYQKVHSTIKTSYSGLRKFIRNIAVFIFLSGFCTIATAQDSLKKPNETTIPPVTLNNTVDNPNSTTLKVTPPKTRQRPRRLTAADSLRIATAQRDSIQKVATATNSAFNIGTPKPIDTAITAPITIVPEVPMLQKSDNPFDILRSSDAASVHTSSTDTTQKAVQQPSAIMPSLLEPSVYSKNFLFWVFLVSLILMAFVVANARAAIVNAYAAISSDSALRQIYKEPMGWGSVAYLALYVLFWLNLAILVYLLLAHFGVSSQYGKLTTFMTCLGGVSLIYMIRHSVLYVISKVFPIEKEVRTYNFIILTVGILLGLLLMPLNIFIAYAPGSLTQLFIYAAYAAILLAYLVRSLRGLTVASPFLIGNKFHFLLYLCTVEFAPLLILIKLVLLKTQ